MDSDEIERNFAIARAAEKDLYKDCELKSWSPYKLSAPLTTLWAVVQMQGAVGNGSLQYFFEADWPENPPYALFIDSLTKVGANKAAAILSSAVALFPFPEPHLDVRARNRFMDECRERDGRWDNEFERLGMQLMDLDQEIDAHLVSYILRNLDFFPTAKPFLAA